MEFTHYKPHSIETKSQAALTIAF